MKTFYSVEYETEYGICKAWFDCKTDAEKFVASQEHCKIPIAYSSKDEEEIEWLKYDVENAKMEFSFIVGG